MSKKFIFLDNLENVYSTDGVEGEKTVREYGFDMPMGYIKVLVTEQPKDSNGEEYYNVYVISNRFRIEPLNCLNEQIPKDSEIKFSEKWAEFKAIEFYLWDKYGNPDKETTLSFEIVEHQH